MSVCVRRARRIRCGVHETIFENCFSMLPLDAVQPRKTLTPQGITHILHNFVIALGKPNTNKIYIQDCQDFSPFRMCGSVCCVVL